MNFLQQWMHHNPTQIYQNKRSRGRKRSQKEIKCVIQGGCRRAGKGIFLRAGQRSGVGTPQTRQRGPWDHSKACWVCVLSQQQKLLSQYMNHCLRCWSYNDTHAEFSRFRYFNNTFFYKKKKMCLRGIVHCQKSVVSTSVEDLLSFSPSTLYFVPPNDPNAEYKLMHEKTHKTNGWNHFIKGLNNFLIFKNMRSKTCASCVKMILFNQYQQCSKENE